MKANPSRDARSIVETVLAAVETGICEDGLVQITGFGSFQVSHRKGRVGTHPRTGQTIQIGSSKNVRFTASRAIKDALGRET